MKYNVNHDKGSEETFGFTSDYPDVQSVEFCNNTSGACLFQSPIPSDWSNDFEFRYPDGHSDISAFKEMHDWVVSTYQIDATGNELQSTYTGVDGKQYTHDTAEYRLAKFKKEFEEHFDLEYALVYYVYTFFALMVDQRAKNLFLTSWDKKHWMCYFYDNDTIYGINNQGDLVLDYYYEDRDQLGDAYVFNGATSTLWVNFKTAFADEIKEKYRELRSNNKLTKSKLTEAYVTNQAKKWPISIYNEDSDYKYISMVRSSNDTSNLNQVRGTGVEHLDYMLDNRFVYCDSMWYAGNKEDYNYPEDYISLRIYTPVDENDNPRTDLVVAPNANITVTPYSSMYVGAKYKANGTLLQERATANMPVTFIPPVNSDTGEEEKFNNTETAVFGASQISSLGDLSALYCGSIKVSKATKLTELIVGSGIEGYKNENLWELEVGTNRLLKKIDIRNCPKLVTPLALSNCPNIQEIYATGSGITGLELPPSGYLKKVYLPGTLTNLTVTNQQYIQEFELDGYDALTTLRIEDTVNIPVEDIMLNAPNLNRIRLIDVTWTAESEDALVQTIDKFKSCLGLDANGNNTNNAVVTGRVYVNEKVSDETVGDIYNNFPDLIVDDGNDEIYIVNYKNWDGTILYSDRLAEGADAIDPIEENLISAPTRPSDEYYSYDFIGWNIIPTNVSRHYIVTAQYATKVAINFAVDGKVIHSEYVTYGSNAEDPVANGTIAAPIKEGTDDLHYVFDGWDGSLLNVTMPRTVNAIFANVFPVRYYVTETSTIPHYVQWIKESEDAYDPVIAEECDVPADIMESTDKKYVYSAWDNIPINITAITKVYATYNTYWAVRFYNESAVVNTQWVKDGNSAIDPVKNNIIDTPSKTSTAQYDFTFRSWDGNYINVTEARNIYAEYSYVTRRYTVEFYNVENGVDVFLWRQEEVMYGSDAVDPVTSGRIPKPVKLGVEDSTKYDYTGWDPSYKNIQGDTKCYAMFRYNDYIQDDWATIAANANNGTATTLYPIGARKEIPITLSDGSEHVVDVEIIAYNHDDIADGSGKATLTFLCKDLPTFERKMYDNQINSGGWKDSDMRAFVNGELFDGMPTELQNVIKPVYKISDGGANSKTLITTEDKCWIPSYDEVGFANNRTDNLSGQGVQYADTFGYGSDGNATRIKYLSDGYTSGRWWLRSSSYGSSSVLFFRVQNSGGVQTDGLWNSYPVAFGFCVGRYEEPLPEIVEPGYMSYGNRAAQIASTYQLTRVLENDTFKYSTNSLFSEDTANDGYSVRNADGRGVMDCSTFVGLCLRGVPYQNSPFVKHTEPNAIWWPVNELSSIYGTEGWEFTELDRQPAGKYHNIGIHGYSSVRLAAHYGEYFAENGEVLFDINNIEDDNSIITADSWKTLKLQPGDLIFWSKSSADPEVQDRFMGISHVAIVSENTSRFFEVTTGDNDKTVFYSKFADKYQEISLICRPRYQTRILPVDENVLNYPWVYGAVKTGTSYGITRETIDANIIKLSGTSTSSFDLKVKGDISNEMAFTLPAGKYRLSGMDNTGVSNSSVSLQIKNIDGTDFATPIVCYAGNNPTFTITKDTDVIILLHIDSGITLNCNITPTLARTT